MKQREPNIMECLVTPGIPMSLRCLILPEHARLIYSEELELIVYSIIRQIRPYIGTSGYGEKWLDLVCLGNTGLCRDHHGRHPLVGSAILNMTSFRSSVGMTWRSSTPT